MIPGHNPLDLLTTSQLAAFLCVSPSAIRHMAREHGIEPVGKEGRESLYVARTFVDTVGQHDRSFGKRRRVKSAKLTLEGEDTYVQPT